MDPPAGVPEYVKADSVIAAALVLLAIGLRRWAQRVEKARPEGQKRHGVTLRRALLFYRFHRSAARFVRIIFYIWALWVGVSVVGLVATAFFEPKAFLGYLFLLFGYVGYAVALRYWAASLETRNGSGASPMAPSVTTAGESRGEAAP
jgi:hypothetical protein